MTTLAYPHIELDAAGEPLITGTDTQVILLAIDRLATAQSYPKIKV